VSYQQFPPRPPGGPPGHPLPVWAPPPPKKSSAPLVVGIIAAAVAVICLGMVLIIALVPAPATTGGKAGAQGSSVQGSGAVSHPQDDDPGLNKPARDGPLQFVVQNVTCGKAQEAYPTDPHYNRKAQGQYCEVRLSIKNLGKDPDGFFTDLQRAVGSDGASYAPDVEAETLANVGGDDTWTINPGNTATTVLVFDIPKNARIVRLKLYESDNTDGVTVKLT
jgi:hypothetical protein